MANLYLVISLTQSGSLQFIEKYMNKNCIAISFICYSFQKERFISKINNIYKSSLQSFYKTINNNLKKGKTVFITGRILLENKQRKELLKNITAEYKKVYAIYIKSPIEGLVKEYQIFKFDLPKLNEDFYGIYTYDVIKQKLTYKGTL